jgi:hypothetical protein
MTLKGFSNPLAFNTMQFTDSVQNFSAAVGFLSTQMILDTHKQATAPKEQIDGAITDAARALDELLTAGHQQIVSAMMEMFESVSWGGSAYLDYEVHERDCQNLFRAIGARMNELQDEDADEMSSHILSEEEEAKDEVFEFTAEKDHLLRCLSES